MLVRFALLLSLVAVGCGGPAPEVMAPPPRPAEAAPVVEAPAGPPAIVCAAVPGPGSARISWAQKNLNDLGYDCGVVDGLPGPRTEACFKTFQRTNLLEETGYLDPATRRALACQI